MIFRVFYDILSFMKTIMPLGIFLFSLFFLFGCSGNPKVTRVDPSAQVDLSGRWNANDFQIVSQSLIKACLESPRVDQFIQQYKSQHNGDLPACLVDNFSNDTAEHIDTSMLSEEIKIAVINSGKMDFVAAGDVLTAIRNERQDQQSYATEDTAAALANEVGAALMLTGKLMYIGDRAGNTQDRYYVASAEMTDISRRLIIWSGKSDEIRKVVKQANYKP